MFILTFDGLLYLQAVYGVGYTALMQQLIIAEIPAGRIRFVRPAASSRGILTVLTANQEYERALRAQIRQVQNTISIRQDSRQRDSTGDYIDAADQTNAMNWDVMTSRLFKTCHPTTALRHLSTFSHGIPYSVSFWRLVNYGGYSRPDRLSQYKGTVTQS